MVEVVGVEASGSREVRRKGRFEGSASQHGGLALYKEQGD
jgi:hypothetical protein